MKITVFRFLLFALCIACINITAASSSTSNDPETLVFGVVPQQAASKLARNWAPLLEYLGNRTDTRIIFATAPDIPTFEYRLAQGEYDLAYMNPYHYTVFAKHPGYRAIAKEKDKSIRGIIVVRKDSPINDLKQLESQTLAFPAPAAFAASVLPRSHFISQGIHITPKYVSSHDSVYMGVQLGLYPAGGGIIRTLNALQPDIREQLRILWKTPPYTPHAIASHPRIEPEIITKVQQAIIEMEKDAAGRELLSGIGFTSLEFAQDEDWDDIRKLGLTLLEDLTKGKQ